jgi:hypothetical protein
MYSKVNSSLGNIENYSLIINHEGEIVSTPFKKEIGSNITEMVKNKQPLKGVLGIPPAHRGIGSEITQGSFITRVNGKETLLTYKEIGSKIGVGGSSGWRLLNLTPTSSLYEELRNVFVFVFVIGSLI